MTDFNRTLPSARGNRDAQSEAAGNRTYHFFYLVPGRFDLLGEKGVAVEG
jgi:hypothetical protein